ncbi:pyridoxal phosphate-dependent aminotransferase [bacterium]|nr:pyridoxal phosphate-dependent aminotransferase [candidate division CSSED10-310 bacterium]
MVVDYLSWYKNIYTELYPFEDCWNLLSSSIPENLDLLSRHVEAVRDSDIRDRMALSNEWGHPVLIQRIAARNQVESNHVMPAIGASNGIYLVCAALCRPGDHTVVESPAYEALLAVPRLLGVDVTSVPRRPADYGIDAERIADAIGSRTRLVMVTNLHNPSGSMLSESDLQALGETVRKRNENVRILVDEIYRDFIPGDHRPAAALDDAVITVSSLTKVYGLGLLRCGWIIAEPALIEQFRRLQSSVYGCGSRILEVVSSVVFDRLTEYRKNALSGVEYNRKTLHRLLQPLITGGLLTDPIPRYGCVYFTHIGGVEQTDTLVDFLAREYRVHVVPGRFFGDAGAVRIGFGGRGTHVAEALTRFAEGVQVFTGGRRDS